MKPLYFTICLSLLLYLWPKDSRATVFADQVVSYGPCSPISALLCPSGVSNPQYGVDSDPSNYALLSTAVGLGFSSYYEVSFPTPAPGGSVVSFMVQPENNILNLNLLQSITIQLFDTSGTLVATQTNFDLTDVDVLSGFGQRSLVNMYSPMGNYVIKSARIIIGGLLQTINTMRVFSVFYNTTCQPVYADTVFNTSTNIALCLTGCVFNAQNMVDGNQNNYGSFDVPVAGVSNMFVEFGFPSPADTNDFIGFTVENVSALISLNLLQNLTATFYDSSGNVQCGISDFSLADIVLIDAGTLQYIIGMKVPSNITQPISRARLSFNGVSILYSLRIYNAFHFTMKSPFALINPSQPVLCQGSQVTLSSPSQASWQWFPGGQTTQSITVSQPGIYTLLVSDSEGCVSSTSFEVVQSPLPPSPAITTDGAPVICNGNPAELSVSTSGDVLWSTGDTSYTIQATQPGLYTVVAIDSNTCVSIADSLMLTQVNYTASINSIGPSAICNGDSAILTTNAVSNILWSTGDTTQTITVTNPGMYYVTGEDTNQCLSAQSGINIVESTFNVSIDGDTVGCDNDPVTLTASGGTQFVWSSSDSSVTSTANSVDVMVPPSPIIVYLQAGDSYGCVSSDQQTVYPFSMVYPPVMVLNDFSNVDYGGSVTIDVANNDTVPAPIITIIDPPQHGTATVTSDSTISYVAASNYSGMDTLTYLICSSWCANSCDEALLILNIENLEELVIPQAVTPNGDGMNDMLKIPGIENYPENELVILNRWGDVIYTAQPYANDWSGQCNHGMKLVGDKVTDGTYFYAFVPSPGSTPIKGFFELRK